MGATPMYKYVYGCEARAHILPIKGALSWGRFTVNFLRTTVMQTVYCDLREGQMDIYFVYIKFAHMFASHYR